MSRELSDMADRLLPGEEGAGGRGTRRRGAAADTAAAPLQQRLQESWQGKVTAAQSCHHPVSHVQHEGNQLIGGTPFCNAKMQIGTQPHSGRAWTQIARSYFMQLLHGQCSTCRLHQFNHHHTKHTTYHLVDFLFRPGELVSFR